MLDVLGAECGEQNICSAWGKFSASQKFFHSDQAKAFRLPKLLLVKVYFWHPKLCKMIDFISPQSKQILLTNNDFLTSEAGEKFPIVNGIPRFVNRENY